MLDFFLYFWSFLLFSTNFLYWASFFWFSQTPYNFQILLTFFLLNLLAVKSLVILGALQYFFPSGCSLVILLTTALWTSKLLTLIFSASLTPLLSKCLGRLKSFLILLALFGPNLRGFLASVNPAISVSPFWTNTKLMELISGPKTQPLTLFLFLVPSLLAL